MQGPVSRRNVEHYRWGGPQRDVSDGWHLVRGAALSVIEEEMPPGAEEARHAHLHSRQFFYVLRGELTIEREGEVATLRAGHGLEIAPGERHQAINRGGEAVSFLVVSAPPSHGDRVAAEPEEEQARPASTGAMSK